MLTRAFFKSVDCKLHNPKILVLMRGAPVQFFRQSSTAPAKKNSRKSDLIRANALQKYGLTDLHLVWPKSAASHQQVDYKLTNPRSVSQMYGQADLSQLPVFQGGFINFGYWPDAADKEKITQEDRIASSKELYKVVGDLCGILKDHSILDVGSGLGYGTAFLSQQYQPKLVVGVDVSPDQVARAKKHQLEGIKSGKLRFTIGEAESMPFTDHSFDYVISVEAAQHFSRMNDFSKETSRILKPGGKLVMTSFFPANREGVDALNAIVPDYHVHGSQNTIEDVQQELSKHMDNVRVKKIGKNVWKGFSSWLDRIGYQHQWPKIWCALYEKGFIDYVIYEATTTMSLKNEKAYKFS